MVHKMLFFKTREKVQYDITIFQTPKYGELKGYRQVYRVTIEGINHKDAIKNVFRMFNVNDLIPKDYQARYLNTGDILLFDEGRKGQTYYKLCVGGWQKVNRVILR
ncbi:hypothetical protein J2Z26_002163 [Bacillus luteolus]|nr:hypothetical protein [Cytobacillus luteolus]